MLLRMVACSVCFAVGLGSWNDCSWFVWAAWAALLIAEVGSFLCADYHLYRSKNPAAQGRTLTEGISPPQLVLKGAWGAYLVAFLLVLIVALAMEVRGWFLVFIAFTAFVGGYNARVWPFMRVAVSTWLPFFSALYLRGRIPSMSGVVAVSCVYAIFVIYDYIRGN
jgi:hypothetical protein